MHKETDGETREVVFDAATAEIHSRENHATKNQR